MCIAKDGASSGEWLTDDADLDAFLQGGEVSSQLEKLWSNYRLGHPECLCPNVEPRGNEVNVLVHVRPRRAIEPKSANEKLRQERSVDAKRAAGAATGGLSSRSQTLSKSLPSQSRPVHEYAGVSFQLKNV